MGRKKHDKLPGLTALGARLRELRLKTGLSQMKLAELMGFAPAHGYKYVLRLEKGQVPNPTLRTLIAYIQACDANWQDVLKELPTTTAAPEPTPELPQPRAAPKLVRPKQPLVPTRPKDSRPLRVRLRSQLLAERAARAEQLWNAVEKAEQATVRLLHSARIVSAQHRQYLAFVRSCCSVVSAASPAKPRATEQQLNALVDASVAKGLDKDVLLEVTAICQTRMAEATDSRA